MGPNIFDRDEGPTVKGMIAKLVNLSGDASSVYANNNMEAAKRLKKELSEVESQAKSLRQELNEARRKANKTR